MESLMLEEIDIYMCQKMKNTTSILFGLIQPSSSLLEVKEPGGAGAYPLYMFPLGVKCRHCFKQPKSTTNSMFSKLLS